MYEFQNDLNVVASAVHKTFNFKFAFLLKDFVNDVNNICENFYLLSTKITSLKNLLTQSGQDYVYHNFTKFMSNSL